MNFRSSGLVACLLAAVTAGCGTATASSPPGVPNAGTGVPSSCQHPAGDVLTLASSGKTYCSSSPLTTATAWNATSTG